MAMFKTPLFVTVIRLENRFSSTKRNVNNLKPITEIKTERNSVPSDPFKIIYTRIHYVYTYYSTAAESKYSPHALFTLSKRTKNTSRRHIQGGTSWAHTFQKFIVTQLHRLESSGLSRQVSDER